MIPCNAAEKRGYGHGYFYVTEIFGSRSLPAQQRMILERTYRSLLTART